MVSEQQIMDRIAKYRKRMNTLADSSSKEFSKTKEERSEELLRFCYSENAKCKAVIHELEWILHGDV